MYRLGRFLVSCVLLSACFSISQAQQPDDEPPERIDIPLPQRPPVAPPPDEPDEPEPEPPPPGGEEFERALDSAGNESVITDSQIQQNIPRGLEGIFQYEPGIQVQSSPGRFGETSINIRGLEGNRVLITVDGVRSADSFQQGPVQLGRGSVDVNLLKQVEIVRGPGSLIYGEGAIGGVVAFETKDPDDFLNLFDNDVYFGLTGSYFSADRGWRETPIVAFRAGDGEALVAYTRRDGHELDTRGAFGADPQEYDGDYLLGKYVHHLDESSELDFSFEFQRQSIETILRSTFADPPGDFNTFVTTPEVFPGALPASRIASDADDDNRRLRYNLTYDYEGESDSFLTSARLQIYYQQSSINDQRLQQFLVPAIVPPQPPMGPANHLITDLGDNFFKQDHFGGRMIFRGELETNLATHALIYGADALRTDTTRLRTGVVTNQDTGTSINSNQISEVTPRKVLPDVTTNRVGMFFRDRIETSLPFAITPGVRVNYYSAQFDLPDPLFDDSSGSPDDVSEWNAQPLIEISTLLTESLESIVRYSRGYRGPPVEDAGIGFVNPLFGYTVIPNVDLTSETSDSLDVGMSLKTDLLAAYAGGYYNHYDGFIDTVDLGLDPISGLLIFQQRNLDAQIYGVEFAGELRLLGDYDEPPASDERAGMSRSRSEEVAAPQFYGWSVFTNFTHSVGDNLEGDIPLDSIPPMFAIVGLRYRASENRWGAEFVSTLVHRKDRYSGTLPDQFIPPGYGIFDLLAYANLSDRVQINAGVFNLFDREYYQWLNVRGVEESQPDVTRFAAPGVNVATTLRLHW